MGVFCCGKQGLKLEEDVGVMLGSTRELERNTPDTD
jgi:hypothetical protein